MNFKKEDLSLDAAKKMDEQDSLSSLREEFIFPKTSTGESSLYFAGHSLGLQPKRAKVLIEEELQDWGKYGVEGHFKGPYPWLPYHEFLTEPMARLVGALPEETVVMNTLTANLHLMMVSFYRPTKSRFKILIENNTFPSDVYAVKSQARFHGFDWREAVVELKPRNGEMFVRPEDIKDQINELGDSLALVMLGNCNYLSGQCFDMKTVADQAHAAGAMCGFNLAHGAGNIVCNLHDNDVDFAVWCSYKYLNSGPGGLAGAFIHKKHLGDPNIPRFEGWWGQNKSTRFEMGPQFDPIPTAEAWQLSNPPIFQLAAIRASLELFDKAGIKNLRAKGDQLTGYFEFLLRNKLENFVQVMTPEYTEGGQTRGNMLCLRFAKDPKQLNEQLQEKGVICDFREPDILRMAPAPMYNSFSDVYRLVEKIEAFANG
ncbi:MAG: kynureninase [Bdellovibrionaceae bacterium]|nr:kynureninase [Pseudobdellovibrionaceae bacterium]|tara:strand:+ start:164207 stop:165493 length:1287 start_codon:yes stop_codon:yes gene_type:complete